LTTPPDSVWGDGDASFSPDGRWIAFVRRRLDLAGDLYLAPSAGGEPRRLTESAGDIAGNAWIPDSIEILFAAAKGGDFTLRRIRIDRNRGLFQRRSVVNLGTYGMQPTVV